VLISSTFYARLFHTKVFLAAFSSYVSALQVLAPRITKLCFGFEILAPKILYEKRAHITLMKLMAGVPL